ncbi:MAG: RidA family protein [Chloroflexota bacterium]
MRIEARLAELGLSLPPQLTVGAGVKLPFDSVRVLGDRAIVSGHGAQGPDGQLIGPFGKVGADVTVEEGYQAARGVALSMIASLQRALGDLDRIVAWVKLLGMVNSAPDFDRHPAVINGASDLILEVFGDAGRHARSAVGVAALPWRIPVEIEGEVLIRP